LRRFAGEQTAPGTFGGSKDVGWDGSADAGIPGYPAFYRNAMVEPEK
jgi:hypothetical protein